MNGRLLCIWRFSKFDLGWDVLPQMDPVHKLEVLLDSPILLEEHVAVVARRPLAQFHVVHQLCPFMD